MLKIYDALTVHNVPWCFFSIVFQGHMLVSERKPTMSGVADIIGCVGEIHIPIKAPQETKYDRVNKKFLQHRCPSNDKGLGQISISDMSVAFFLS